MLLQGIVSIQNCVAAFWEWVYLKKSQACSMYYNICISQVMDCMIEQKIQVFSVQGVMCGTCL